MRKFLLLLCILSITFSAKAQLFGKHYDEGSYYDLDGVKHSGLIAWTAPEQSIFGGHGDHIFYKPEKKADNVKLKSTELRSFVIGVDSFVVSQNEIFSWKPFLNVLVNTSDTLKLYCSMVKRSTPGFGVGVGSIGAVALSVGTSFSYYKKTYYYGTTPDNAVKLEKKQFIEVMSKIVADKPDVVERIKNKKLRMGDMDDLIYLYRNGVMPPAQAPDQFSGAN